MTPLKKSILRQLKTSLNCWSKQRHFLHMKTNIHGSNVVFVRLPDFLHYLFLSPGAGFHAAFHRDGAFRIVQCQLLQSADWNEEARKRLEITGGRQLITVQPQLAIQTQLWRLAMCKRRWLDIMKNEYAPKVVNTRIVTLQGNRKYCPSHLLSKYSLGVRSSIKSMF